MSSILLPRQADNDFIHHALPIAKPGISQGSWFLDALLALTVFGFLPFVVASSAQEVN
jgi:hypothetical protein